MAKIVELSGDLNDLPESIKQHLRERLGESSASPKQADPLAQMVELQSRWTAANAQSGLKVGDLCMEKEGFLSHADNIGPLVYLIWSAYEHGNEQHRLQARDFIREFGSLPFIDVWVAYLPAGGKHPLFRPHSLQFLRPLTAEERASLDRLNTMDATE